MNIRTSINGTLNGCRFLYIFQIILGTRNLYTHGGNPSGYLSLLGRDLVRDLFLQYVVPIIIIKSRIQQKVPRKERIYERKKQMQDLKTDPPADRC